MSEITLYGVGVTSAPSARAVSDKGGAGRKRTIEEEKSVLVLGMATISSGIVNVIRA